MLKFIGKQPPHLSVHEMGALLNLIDEDVYKERVVCCSEAVLNPRHCVCLYFWSCPIHGETHIDVTKENHD